MDLVNFVQDKFACIILYYVYTYIVHTKHEMKLCADMHADMNDGGERGAEMEGGKIAKKSENKLRKKF